MSFSPTAPQAPEPAESGSPWWQTLLFAAAAALLVLKAPQTAKALGFLGLLIFVHELGHFAVARWRGMRVETFSLGFGPALVKVKRGDTVYQLAAFPLGGYVKPAGEQPETDEQLASARPDEFSGQPWWSRTLVLLAGPAMNLLFPVLALSLAYATLGRPNPEGPPRVAEVMAGSGAAAAGLRAGDRILQVQGERVRGAASLVALVEKHAPGQGGPLRLLLQRESGPLELTAQARAAAGGKPRLGLRLDPGPPPLARALAVGVLSPAEKAGLKAGDELLAVDGRSVRDGDDFNRLFAAGSGERVRLRVRRGAQVLELSAERRQPLPADWDPALVGLLGLEFAPADPAQALSRDRLGPSEALLAAAADTWRSARLLVSGLRDILTGRLKASENLAGPVGILRLASQQAERGWDYLLSMMCNISLSLGLMNLLPVPALDGGSILLCLLEGLRGRPLRLKTQARLQNLGLALLGGLLVFAVFNDLRQLPLPGSRPAPSAAAAPAAPAPPAAGER